MLKALSNDNICETNLILNQILTPIYLAFILSI
jgi:hypothetical protein